MKPIQLTCFIFLLLASCQGPNIKEFLPNDYRVTYLERVHRFPHDVHIYKIRNEFVDVSDFKGFPKDCNDDCWEHYHNYNELQDEYTYSHIGMVAEVNADAKELLKNLKSGKDFLYFCPKKLKYNIAFTIIDIEERKMYCFENINKNW
ncbi:MAG: hypothetical protein EAZ55_14820 [Cytophagales bacterium]|nr:MAG: hypothetical protein EAZ55_14820 [Cytophagales bacterium]